MDDKPEVISCKNYVNGNISADDLAFLRRTHSVFRFTWIVAKWTVRWLLKPVWNTIWAILLGTIVIPLVMGWLKLHNWFNGSG